MRLDFEIISDWVTPNSHVIDLGCGDGELLAHLHHSQNVTGYGLEIDEAKIYACIKKGVNVIQHNLDTGLAQFNDDAFDFVISTQSLQTLHYPHWVLNDMLRIGKECIVTFPNFGFWQSRLYLLTQGMMPVTKNMPKNWYDTDNIHFCTIKDFEQLCQKNAILIKDRRVINQQSNAKGLAKALPNLFAEVALYRLSR